MVTDYLPDEAHDAHQEGEHRPGGFGSLRFFHRGSFHESLGTAVPYLAVALRGA